MFLGSGLVGGLYLLRKVCRKIWLVGLWRERYVLAFKTFSFYLRPYRDEPSASRPIRADKHRRGQRVLTWVTSREHCAAAGFFLHLETVNPPSNLVSVFIDVKLV